MPVGSWARRCHDVVLAASIHAHHGIADAAGEGRCHVPLRVNVGGAWQTAAGPWHDVQARLDHKSTTLPVELSPVKHHLLITGRWSATPESKAGR
jgi:hypothetical protein